MLTMGMMLGGPNTLPRYSFTISTNGGNWASTYSAGLPSSFPVDVTLTIASGIERQGSTSLGNGAIAFFVADGSIVRIVNNGYILGAGGWGGDSYNSATAQAGGNGRPAIEVQGRASIIITNGSGYIWGGGGGGGGGGDGTSTAYGGGGGGGAGGGEGGSSWNGAWLKTGADGTTGRLGAGGAGGSATGDGGDGGAGGGFGSAGAAGTDGAYGAAAGGAAGHAVKHDAGSTVTWVSGVSRILGPVGT